MGGPTLITELINVNESVLFQFTAGSATAVSLQGSASLLGGSPDPNLNLEGFGVGGGSLGTMQFNPITLFFDISSFFGNVPLSGFQITGNGTQTGITVGSISFTPAPQQTVVPEPGTLALLLVGGMTTGARFLRRRRA